MGGSTSSNDSISAARDEPGWRGRLILLPGLVLYVGQGGHADTHQHHAVQLVWSLEGEVNLQLGGRSLATAVTLIPASTPHALDVRGPVVMWLVERHAALGLALDELARGEHEAAVHAELTATGPPDIAGPTDALASWAAGALRRLTGVTSLEGSVSEPIVRVLAAVDTGALNELAAAAKVACLSPTRLTHRFGAEVGLPFRRFVLWSRVKRAVIAVQAGHDLTRAAIEAGFADSAHFSRTFRKTIGLAPSSVLPFLEIAHGAWSR